MTESGISVLGAQPEPSPPQRQSPIASNVECAGSDEARRLWLLNRVSKPRLAIPFLLALGILLFVVNLGGYPIYSTGEPREAIRIFDVVHGGGFVLPTQPGIGLPWKPPLMYWLGALVSALAGRVNEWTVRLPSAMLAVSGVLVCYLYVGRLFNRRSALISALILATSFEYLQSGSAARVDMTLTFFMEVAFFEFLMVAEGLRRRWMLLYAAVAAAILAKGPIGAFLPAAVALIWLLLERRPGRLKQLHVLRGAVVVIIVAGGWYLSAALVGGMEFVRRQVLDENLYRLLPTHAVQEPHAHSFYYIELALIAGFMPWSAITPLAIVQFFRESRPLDPRLKYLVVWFVTVLVFFNFPRSKRGVYLLALYPSISALTAVFLNDAFSYPKRTERLVRGLKWAGGLFFLVVAMAGLLATLLMIGSRPSIISAVLNRLGVENLGFVPELAAMVTARPVVSVLLALTPAVSGVYLLRSKALAERLFGGTLAGYCCLVLAAHLVVVPAIANTLTLKGFTLKSMAIVDGKTLANLGGVNFDFAFYSRRDIPLASLREAEQSDYLLCSRKFYDLAPEAFRRRFVNVLASEPTDLKGGGRMLLLRRADPAVQGPGSGA